MVAHRPLARHLSRDGRLATSVAADVCDYCPGRLTVLAAGATVVRQPLRPTRTRHASMVLAKRHDVPCRATI